jgi:hypothetical protein
MRSQNWPKNGPNGPCFRPARPAGGLPAITTSLKRFCGSPSRFLGFLRHHRRRKVSGPRFVVGRNTAVQGCHGPLQPAIDRCSAAPTATSCLLRGNPQPSVDAEFPQFVTRAANNSIAADTIPIRKALGNDQKTFLTASATIMSGVMQAAGIC